MKHLSTILVIAYVVGMVAMLAPAQEPTTQSSADPALPELLEQARERYEAERAQWQADLAAAQAEIEELVASLDVDSLPVLYAINNAGAPDAATIGMSPSLYAYHGKDTPAEWASLAVEAARTGRPVWANYAEPHPERWAEMADAMYEAAPAAVVGSYNQLTRDFWKSREHWKDLIEAADAPGAEDLDALRQHVRTYGPIRDWPERQKLEALPRFEDFAQYPTHWKGRQRNYDGWIASVRDFCRHPDRRVKSLDLLLQSVYLPYAGKTAATAYLYAFENLYWHARFSPAEVVATLMPTYHARGDAGKYLRDDEIEAVVMAARDVEHHTGRHIRLSLWTGNAAWNDETARVARTLVKVAGKAARDPSPDGQGTAPQAEVEVRDIP